MTRARRKTKKHESDDGITEAVIRELEFIAEELKTSTVSYSKERLRALIARLRGSDIPAQDSRESDKSEKESTVEESRQ